MPFNRSAILRAAHAETRRQMQPTEKCDYPSKWCPKRRRYVEAHVYAFVFADELKKAWARARMVPAADPVMTEAEAAEVASLRYFASLEPLTAAGTVAFRAAYAQAGEIIAAAQARRAA